MRDTISYRSHEVKSDDQDSFVEAAIREYRPEVCRPRDANFREGAEQYQAYILQKYGNTFLIFLQDSIREIVTEFNFRSREQAQGYGDTNRKTHTDWLYAKCKLAVSKAEWRAESWQNKLMH